MRLPHTLPRLLLAISLAVLLSGALLAKAPSANAAPQDCTSLVEQLSQKLRAGADIKSAMKAVRTCVAPSAQAAGHSAGTSVETAPATLPASVAVAARFFAITTPLGYTSCMYFNVDGTILGAVGSSVVTGTYLGSPSFLSFFTFAGTGVTNGWGLTFGPYIWFSMTWPPINVTGSGMVSNCNVAGG